MVVSHRCCVSADSRQFSPSSTVSDKLRVDNHCTTAPHRALSLMMDPVVHYDIQSTSTA